MSQTDLTAPKPSFLTSLTEAFENMVTGGSPTAVAETIHSGVVESAQLAAASAAPSAAAAVAPSAAADAVRNIVKPLADRVLALENAPPAAVEITDGAISAFAPLFVSFMQRQFPHDVQPFLDLFGSAAGAPPALTPYFTDPATGTAYFKNAAGAVTDKGGNVIAPTQ